MAEKDNRAALPDILVVGIAGGSGGGKTTLTTNLIRRFGDKVCIVHHDNYYRAHDDLTYEERTRLNYDCPEAFETEMMIEHLRLLKQGRSVHCPVYDFKVHNRSGETIEIEPRPVILVEGILIFADPTLSDLMDIRVFVDADADVRLARRVLRDTEKRGRTVRSVVEQWQNTVKPHARKVRGAVEEERRHHRAAGRQKPRGARSHRRPHPAASRRECIRKEPLFIQGRLFSWVRSDEERFVSTGGAEPRPYRRSKLRPERNRGQKTAPLPFGRGAICCLDYRRSRLPKTESTYRRKRRKYTNEVSSDAR